MSKITIGDSEHVCVDWHLFVKKKREKKEKKKVEREREREREKE